MPTYEYRCPKGHQFEHFFRTISAGEKVFKCPQCGEWAERLMSGGTGLHFKGSGFYITDYGKDGKKDQKKAAESSKNGVERVRRSAGPAAAGPATAAARSRLTSPLQRLGFW